MPRPVESRILPACDDLSTGHENRDLLGRKPCEGSIFLAENLRQTAHKAGCENRLIVGPQKPVLRPFSARLEAQIPSAATTCRKSGSFARGDVYLTASYHGDK